MKEISNKFKKIFRHFFTKPRIVNKIAFFISEEYMLDHYLNILKKLENNNFVIVLAEKFKKKKYKNFLNYIKSYSWNTVFISDVLYSIKYKIFITHLYLGGSCISSEGLLTKIKIYFYLFFKKIGISYLQNKTKEQYFQKKLGIYNIKFFYGADNGKSKGDANFEEYNELFDEFFTHGPRDSLIIKKHFKGKIFEMGYPRYDNYFKNINKRNIKKEILKKNSCNLKKSTILWICTVSPYFSTIEIYQKYMQKLTKKYNVILRPHPIEIDPKQERFKPKVLDIVKSNLFINSINSSQEMSELYLIADYVFCDYGGAIFSAIYLNKKILLLNNKNFNKERYIKNTASSEIRNFLPSVNEVISNNFDAIIKNKLNSKKNLIQVEKTRKIFFGDQSNKDCSTLVVNRLIELFNKNIKYN